MPNAINAWYHLVEKQMDIRIIRRDLLTNRPIFFNCFGKSSEKLNPSLIL